MTEPTQAQIDQQLKWAKAQLKHDEKDGHLWVGGVCECIRCLNANVLLALHAQLAEATRDKSEATGDANVFNKLWKEYSDRAYAAEAALATAREAVEEIKTTIFYHMVQHADERGDRAVLGKAKELAIETIRALSQSPAPDGWRFDMENAPKDEPVHLGFAHMAGFDVIAHWEGDDWALTGMGQDAERLHGRPKPTAWRLLPAPPSAPSPKASR